MNEFEICYMENNKKMKVNVLGVNKVEAQKEFKESHPNIASVVSITNKSDYKSLKVMSFFITIIGWIAVIVGIFFTLRLAAKGGSESLVIPSSITISLIGFLLILLSQVIKVFIDNTKYSKAMLHLMRENSK